MPVPTQYTEGACATYLVTTLSSVSTYLAWDIASPEVAEAVIDTALALGVTDLSTASVGAVRALGAVAVLQRAKVAAAPRYDIEEDGQRFLRSQAYKAISEALADAERRAMVYDPSYTIRVDTLSYPHDPYAYVPTELRAL